MAAAGSGSPTQQPSDPNRPPTDPGDPTPPSDEPLVCDGSTLDPGPAPLRLLTRAQYLQTVEALVGAVDGLPAALGVAVEASAFGLKQPDISQVELEGFQNAADLIAQQVTSDDARLRALVPCANGAAPSDCARQFIERFGARAYRAPLTGDADIERHLALYRKGAETSHAHGIELVLRGMLQAPRFLYRVEIGTGVKRGEHAVALSGYEIATRLSYFVTGGPPDAELIAAAEDGRLSTPDGVAEAMTTLLASERGAGLVRDFLAALLHVDGVQRAIKDEALYPEWSDDALRTALRDQALRFFDHVLDDEGGALPSLFTSRTVFVNRELADYYGEQGGGGEFRAVQRDDGTASGILTLPALLSVLAKPDESSPIYRGKFVREVLLCQQLPAPPANIPKPPQVEPDVSTRERLRQHERDTACSGCHRLLDPIGFGFEHFDAIGRYRDDDGGKPVDARGEVVDSADADGAFDGVAELGARLAQSDEVEQCIARQFFRFALGRFEQEFDVCSMQQLLGTFRASGQDLRTLPRAVVSTDAFMYRRPID